MASVSAALSALLLLAGVPGVVTSQTMTLSCTSLDASVADSFCNENCNHDPPFCPSAVCSCTATFGAATATGTAPAVSTPCISVQPALATDDWCQATCDVGTCPASLCLCGLGVLTGQATTFVATQPGAGSSCQSISPTLATDTWCEARCNAGNCPLSLCLCAVHISSHSQAGHCHAVSPLASDTWCDASCAAGNCPAELCTCAVTDSTTPATLARYAHDYSCCDNEVSEAFFVSCGDVYKAEYDGTTGADRASPAGATLCADFIDANDIEIGMVPCDPTVFNTECVERVTGNALTHNPFQTYLIVSDFQAATISYVPPGCGAPRIITSFHEHGIAAAQAIAIYGGNIVAATTSQLVYIKLNDDFSYREQQILAMHTGDINSMEPHPDGSGLFYAQGDMIGLMTSIGSSIIFADWFRPSLEQRTPDIQDLVVSTTGGVHFTVPDSNQMWHCPDLTDSSTCQPACDDQGLDSVTCDKSWNPWGIAEDCAANVLTTNKAGFSCTWQEAGSTCTDATDANGASWTSTAGASCAQVVASNLCGTAANAAGVSAAAACCGCSSVTMTAAGVVTVTGGNRQYNEVTPTWCSDICMPEDVEVWSSRGITGGGPCVAPSTSPSPSPSPSPTSAVKYYFSAEISVHIGLCRQPPCAVTQTYYDVVDMISPVYGYTGVCNCPLINQPGNPNNGRVDCTATVGCTSSGEGSGGLLALNFEPSVLHSQCNPNTNQMGSSYTLRDGTILNQCVSASNAAVTCDCVPMPATVRSQVKPTIYAKTQQIAQIIYNSPLYQDWSYEMADSGLNFNTRPAWTALIDCNQLYKGEQFIIAYPYRDTPATLTGTDTVRNADGTSNSGTVTFTAPVASRMCWDDPFINPTNGFGVAGGDTDPLCHRNNPYDFFLDDTTPDGVSPASVDWFDRSGNRMDWQQILQSFTCSSVDSPLPAAGGLGYTAV